MVALHWRFLYGSIVKGEFVGFAKEKELASEGTASSVFPWVTGNTPGDPNSSHSQLLFLLSNLLGGITNS